jgi:transposase
MPDIFERPNKKSASERESEDREEQMLKTIGTQKIEIDWLKKSIVNCTAGTRIN